MSSNWELILFILCILFDPSVVIFNWIYVRRQTQENQIILMIVAQFIPWILQYFIFKNNYNMYNMKWIQFAISIIFTLSTVVYLIWNAYLKSQQEKQTHSQECININQLEKVRLLENDVLEKQNNTSNYGFNQEFEAKSSFQQKYLHQLFEQDTLCSLRELNLNSYDIIEFQHYDSQYLNHTIMDVILKCLRQIDAQQNFEDIKIAIWNKLKTIQNIQSKILDISKTLQYYNKIREQINVLVIGNKISHQGLSNNKMILILSESQSLLGYYIENKITKKIESLPQDLTTSNLNRNQEIIFQKFEISNIGNFLAQIINDLLVQQFGQQQQILESMWSQYLQCFNFLNNANQLQHQLKEDNFTFLQSFYNCKFQIIIFCISYSHNLVEEFKFKKEGKQLTIYIDIENNQIGFQVIRNDEKLIIKSKNDEFQTQDKYLISDSLIQDKQQANKPQTLNNEEKSLSLQTYSSDMIQQDLLNQHKQDLNIHANNDANNSYESQSALTKLLQVNQDDVKQSQLHKVFNPNCKDQKQVSKTEQDISPLTHQMADEGIKLDQSQQQILQRQSLSSIETSSEKISQQDHLLKEHNDNVENNEEEFKNRQQQESINNQLESQNLGEENLKKVLENDLKNIPPQFQYQENNESQTVQQAEQVGIEIKETDSDLKTQQQQYQFIENYESQTVQQAQQDSIDIKAIKNDLNNQPPQFQNVNQVQEPIETITIQNASQDGKDQPPQFQYDNQEQKKQEVQASQQVKQDEIQINQTKIFNQPPQFQNIIQAQEEANSQITLDNNQIQQYKEQYQKQHYDTVNKTRTFQDSNSTDNTNQEFQQLKHQQDSSINSKKVDYQSYLIINQRFYLASFKQRKVEDEYLQKFIRGQKDVQQYQLEYNLDGSQEELLNHQISKFVPIRGDGNCMFTSIGFQYLYYNIIDEERFKGLIELIDQTEFKQKFQNEEVETKEEQKILRDEFKDQLKWFTEIEDQQQLLDDIAYSINNHAGPFYGLMVIFLRNYFRKVLQDFYENDEMKFLIQDPEQINELITWEFMYDEADIALKLFAQKEKILIKCFKKMNVNDKIVDISDYHDDNQKEFPYKIGLAFQPGHYNAILVKN